MSAPTPAKYVADPIATVAKGPQIADETRHFLEKGLDAGMIDAIERGVVKMNDVEVLELSQLDPALMKEVASLMHVHAWSLKKALRCIKRPVDEESRVQDLIGLCIAGGGRWSGMFGGGVYQITVEHTKPELLAPL